MAEYKYKNKGEKEVFPNPLPDPLRNIAQDHINLIKMIRSMSDENPLKCVLEMYLIYQQGLQSYNK